MKNIRYSFLIWFFAAGVYAQTCDNTFESLKVADGVIFSSKLGIANGTPINGAPRLTKVNEFGDTVWQMQDNAVGYHLRDMRLQQFSDGFIYVTVELPNDYYLSSNFQLWKVNAVTGALVWKTPVYQSEDDVAPTLLDYKADKLLFMYPKADTNGGTIAGFSILSIDRTTAAAPLYETTNEPFKTLSMASDSKGNIIYAYQRTGVAGAKAVIRKINGTNFNNVLWEKGYYTNNTAANANLATISKIVIDKYDDLYAFSGSDRMDLFKIDSDTGAEIWKTIGIAGSDEVRNYKFLANSLYVSFQHLYVGSAYTAFEMAKINTDTGMRIWSSNQQHMTISGMLSTHGGDKESIYSFDLDCNGDIYATGYYAASNYGPGAWGIMKINGQTGVKIAQATPNTSAFMVDWFSFGRGAFYFNSGPLFLGNLQFSEYNSIRTIVKSDASLNLTEVRYPCNAPLAVTAIEAKNIKLYPNPVKSLLHIEIPETQQLQSAALLSITGAVLQEYAKGVNLIDLSAFSAGIYFLKIETNSGTNTQKIIKQ